MLPYKKQQPRGHKISSSIQLKKTSLVSPIIDTTPESTSFEINTRKLAFINHKNDISTQSIIISNISDHAIRFHWEYQPNSFVKDVVYVERFFFCNKMGVILPRTSFEFKISFRSKTAGVQSQYIFLIIDVC
jgi:hypothetical protein